MSKYRKFAVAVIGAILIGLNNFAGIEIGLEAQQIADMIITVLTAFGVYQVPNETA